jgi:hypothetical protein
MKLFGPMGYASTTSYVMMGFQSLIFFFLLPLPPKVLLSYLSRAGPLAQQQNRKKEKKERARCSQ